MHTASHTVESVTLKTVQTTLLHMQSPFLVKGGVSNPTTLPPAKVTALSLKMCYRRSGLFRTFRALFGERVAGVWKGLL
eukprot:6146225-Amphidinium_carterae.1